MLRCYVNKVWPGRESQKKHAGVWQKGRQAHYTVKKAKKGRCCQQELIVHTGRAGLSKLVETVEGKRLEKIN